MTSHIIAFVCLVLVCEKRENGCSAQRYIVKMQALKEEFESIFKLFQILNCLPFEHM